MSALIQKIANWLANEIVVKRLANHPKFLDVAHKAHVNIQKGTKFATEATTNLSKEMEVVKKELANEWKKQQQQQQQTGASSSAAPRKR